MGHKQAYVEGLCIDNDIWLLVGKMTIEELALFYFQKEIIRDFTIL
jgi:hypothetical protein